MDILTISPPFLPAPVSRQFLCSAVTRALLIVLQCLPVQHCCPLIGAPRCCSLEAISQSANFTFLWGMCFMEENHWLLPHKMWQLCYIPNQHHHLLHQCCAAQCAEILRAGIKCCQSNLDQAQFSGLNISCKYLLFLKTWKSRFWAALTSALQNCMCFLETGVVRPIKACGWQHQIWWENWPGYHFSHGLKFCTPWAVNRKEGLTAPSYSLVYHHPIQNISGR